MTCYEEVPDFAVRCKLNWSGEPIIEIPVGDMKRHFRWLVGGLLTVAVLYFAAAGIAVRSYWGGLFWGTYLSWLPAYDVIKGPQQTFRERSQYRAAVAFITQRMLTPSTARFCSAGEARFGTDQDGNPAMVGWVDAQNAFGAMIRSHFKAVFQKGGGETVVLRVEWPSDDGSEKAWR